MKREDREQWFTGWQEKEENWGLQEEKRRRKTKVFRIKESKIYMKKGNIMYNYGFKICEKYKWIKTLEKNKNL